MPPNVEPSEAPTCPAVVIHDRPSVSERDGTVFLTIRLPVANTGATHSPESTDRKPSRIRLPIAKRISTYPSVSRVRNSTICRQFEPFISLTPKISPPTHEPTANMASCRPSSCSLPIAFIMAVTETSKALKLMLKVTNTSSSGRMP